MGTKKLTDLERLQLLTMYVAGFQKEAQQHALDLGVSRHYATILYARWRQPYRTSPRKLKKWERAVNSGIVTT